MLEEVESTVRLLERNGLKYMVSGGIASSYWGFPRSTTDIDIIVPLFFDSEKDALQKVEDELKKNGWEIKADVGRPLIAQKPAVRLDFWSIKSLYDRERFERKIKVKLEDFDIWITTPEDLIIQKLMWYRSRDVEDVKGIIKRQKKLDWDYIKRWVKKLGIEERLKGVVGEERR